MGVIKHRIYKLTKDHSAMKPHVDVEGKGGKRENHR